MSPIVVSVALTTPRPTRPPKTRIRIEASSSDMQEIGSKRPSETRNWNEASSKDKELDRSILQRQGIGSKCPPETNDWVTMPSSRFTDGTSSADDGGERLDDVKVDISDNKLLEFKFHLATLPKAQRADLLDQLKL